MHALEGIPYLGGLLLNQFPGHLPKRQLLLAGACPDLDAESAKPASKLDSRLPEPTADLSGGRFGRLAFAPFQPSKKPEQPRHILGSKAIALQAQPIEVYLGVPTGIGCLSQLSQSLSHFLRHAAFELRAIGTGAASKASEADSKIVQRLGISSVRQPGLGAFYLIDITQGDEAGRFLGRSVQQVGWKARSLHAGSGRFRERGERTRGGVDRGPVWSPLLETGSSAGGGPDEPKRGTNRRAESTATRADSRARV